MSEQDPAHESAAAHSVTPLRPIDPKRARARAVAAPLFVLAVEIALFALLPRAGFGPLPLLLGSIVLVVFAVVVLDQRSTEFARALGAEEAIPLGAAAGLVMSLPMVAALAIGWQRAEVPSVLHVARASLAAALAEELVFRGYAFRALATRAGWGAPIAGVVTAVAFGVARAAALDTPAPLELVEAFAIAAATGGWYAWLVAAWDGSIWPALGLHFGMNLALVLFVPASGLGTPSALAPHAGRLASFVVSIAITVAAQRLRRRRSAA